MGTTAVVFLVLSVVLAGWALWSWHALRRARAYAHDLRRLLDSQEDDDAEARRAARELSTELQQTKGELLKAKEQLDEEHATRERLERVRATERAWLRELRGQVAELHRELGTIGDTGDVRATVLQVAMQLLGAKKGLLLSREDDDADGDLDLVAARGFEHDPEHSGVAQRFAREVLASDQTIRENDSAELAHERTTPADEEIDNLVAIPIYIRDRFSGVVVAANKAGGFHEYDNEVLLALGDHAGAVLENGRLRGRLRTTYLGTVQMLADAIEAKDAGVRDHSDDMTAHVAAVAGRLGLEPRRREELVFASLLHDIGKLGISERILLKPGPLDDQERSVVQLHPRIGYRLVDQVPELRGIGPAILHHHEWFDGSGYPAGLSGEAIPVAARIISIADAYCAMTSERPYSEARSAEDACKELERCAGTQFDPELVQIFCQEMRTNHAERANTLAEALDDPEIAARLDDRQPLLGYGSYSLVDNLTLLASHRRFHELANAEAARADVQDEGFAVVLVELLQLGEVNQSEGYAAGDAAIQALADVLQWAALRANGTAARLGGPVLGLLIRGGSENDAERLTSEISAQHGEAPALRCGYAIWRPGDDGDAVIERARRKLSAETTELTPVPPS